MYIDNGHMIISDHEIDMLRSDFNSSGYDKTPDGFMEYANDLERIAKRNGGAIDISMVIPSIMPAF